MPKSSLFDLIQSLSMSEKRFFKMFSNRYTRGYNNDYLKLFDLIDKMDEYDDKKIKKAQFIKNPSAEKNYLYSLILKSLNQFHSQNTSKIKLYNHLISIEVLYQKGLYKQCFELIQKAKKIAVEKELFRQLLSLTEIEQEVYLKDLNYIRAVASMEGDNDILSHINKIAEINYLTTKGYNENLSIGVARDEKQLSEFKKLIEDPVFTVKGGISNNRSTLYQMSLPMTYNMVAGETVSVIESCKKMIKHYEENKFLIEFTSIGYVSSNFILGAAYRQSKQYKKAYLQVEKLGDIIYGKYVKMSQKATASALIYRYILHFQLLLLENRYEEALLLYPESVSQLKDYHVFIGKPQLYDLYFQYSKMFFISGDLDKTLYYTNEILNDLKFKDRDDFAITLRLFNLIVHFELENDLTLEYMSLSTYQYFRRKKKLYKAEGQIISFINNYSNYKHKDIVREKLLILKDKLGTLYLDKYEKGAFRLFDFRLWVEHLIKNISIKDILRD